MNKSNNIDEKTVDGFGNEWNKFSYSDTRLEELEAISDGYFSILDWSTISKDTVALDVGCGTGRWAKLIAPKVKTLVVLDPSSEALEIARHNLRDFKNVIFVNSPINSFETDLKFDLIYSLGVLHHVPDTLSSIKKISNLIKQNGKFLVYLYYRFDNRSVPFRIIWKLSDFIRFFVSRLPFNLRSLVAELYAVLVYLPLSMCARLFSFFGFNVDGFPLSYYKDKSYYVMRTDSLDRFGTRLEKRFTRSEIKKMLSEAEFEEVIFSENAPYWVALGVRK